MQVLECYTCMNSVQIFDHNTILCMTCIVQQNRNKYSTQIKAHTLCTALYYDARLYYNIVCVREGTSCHEIDWLHRHNTMEHGVTSAKCVLLHAIIIHAHVHACSIESQI